MLTIRATMHAAGNTVPQIIPVVQGDTARAILFTIADFTIPNGATANYYIQKPSGLAVYNSGTIDGNTVLVELTAQSIIEPGDNYLQVRILKDDDIVTSFDCILLVKPFRGIDATQSTGEMTIFDQAERAAAAQFQEDAEAIAAEVIESIPPDYTALSNQVSDLSADLSDLETSVNNGKIMASGEGSVTLSLELYTYLVFTRNFSLDTETVNPGQGYFILEEAGYDAWGNPLTFIPADSRVTSIEVKNIPASCSGLAFGAFISSDKTEIQISIQNNTGTAISTSSSNSVTVEIHYKENGS